jgi:hypothetical protein
MSDITVPPPTLPQFQAGQLQANAAAIVHALCGAQYGDLEFDVGKSIRWTQWYVDDVFITDVNLGTPRYWIVNWTLTFPQAYHAVTGINFFAVPEKFRKEQWRMARAERNLQFDPDDWVLFVDAHEGLCIDTRDPQPDDADVEPFRSYLYREIERANDASKDRVVLPFYAFVRHDDVITAHYESPAFQDGDLGYTTATSSMGTPYYIPDQGLTRLIKVSVLDDPSFDWTTIDQPQPWEVKAGTGTPFVPGYLTATVGTATTPDPGLLPAEFVLVYKVQGPTGGTPSQTIACQWISGQLCWLLRRIVGSGTTTMSMSNNGSTATITATAAAVAPSGDEYLAFAVTLNEAGKVRVTTKRSLDSGVTWSDLSTNNIQNTLVPFDTPAVVRIGGSSAGTTEPFVGRIYWCEMRTGTDPKAGTVVWRFDANEYPGTGTSYVDPRGRTWTLTTASAITPKVLAVPAAPAVNTSIVSYGYAHWNLQDIVPPATTVEPLSEANDDGWRMRKLLSMVRPVTGLPYDDPWKDPSQDDDGQAGPWAAADQFTPDPEESQPVTPDPTLSHLLVGLYDNVMRLNMRDGVWYEGGELGNIPLEWDDDTQTWHPRDMTPQEWHGTESWVAPVA